MTHEKSFARSRCIGIRGCCRFILLPFETLVNWSHPKVHGLPTVETVAEPAVIRLRKSHYELPWSLVKAAHGHLMNRKKENTRHKHGSWRLRNQKEKNIGEGTLKYKNTKILGQYLSGSLLALQKRRSILLLTAVSIISIIVWSTLLLLLSILLLVRIVDICYGRFYYVSSIIAMIDTAVRRIVDIFFYLHLPLPTVL